MQMPPYGHEEKNGDFGSVDGKFRPYAVGIIVIIIEVCYFIIGWYLAHNVWETSYTVTTDIEMKLASLLMGANDRTYGTEKRESTDFIVTSGIADWAIKFKTGTKSEYCIVNIMGR